MATIQSDAFTNTFVNGPIRNEKIRVRLQACADRDSANISQGRDPPGADHVIAIHQALVALVPDHRIDKERELDKGVYGRTTAAAVLRFKSDPALNGTEKKILGPGQRTPDAIVGKQTIAALDSQMLKKEGANVPPKPAATAPKVDIIVFFRGAEVVNDLSDNEIMPSALLTDYNKKREQNKDRRLVLMGQRTNDIKADALITTFVKKLTEKIKDNETQGIRANETQGELFIYGSSAGGRNALDLAARLTEKEIPIAFIAILDTVWFQKDTTTVPNDNPKPTNTPRFNPPGKITAISKDNKLDFFQTGGNRSERRSSPLAGFARIFTSDETMGGEIHGPVTDFVERDVTSAVEATQPDTDRKRHDNAIDLFAVPEVRGRIKKLLDTL